MLTTNATLATFKKTFFAMVFSLTIFTATAQGLLVNVDFSSLGINTVDITLENNPAGLTLNGVNMGYDNYGSAPDFASADQVGIYGTTYGGLDFNFSSPATALNFDFSVLSVSGPDANSLVVLFGYGGTWGDVVTVPGVYTPYSSDPTMGEVDGSLAYSGPVFDQAVLYFDPVQSDPAQNPYYFTVGNISYVVPEPATWSLFTLGLSGLLIKSRKSAI
jgi:hypothetical protein